MVPVHPLSTYFISELPRQDLWIKPIQTLNFKVVFLYIAPTGYRLKGLSSKMYSSLTENQNQSANIFSKIIIHLFQREINDSFSFLSIFFY